MVIYLTTNLINGKKYIGKDEKNNPEYLGSGIYLTRSINKHGKENFKKEIIEYCNTTEELNKKEIYWIDFHKACESDQFYNISKGGDGGNTLKGYSEEQKKEIHKKQTESRKWYKHSDETKEKISKKHKGKKLSDITKLKLSEYNKVKKWSQEQKDKFIKIQTGHLTSEETRVKISKATKGKNLGNIPWNKNIPMSNESKNKISISKSGKNCGSDNSSYGKIWLNNGNKNLYVLKNEIDSYLNNGYKMGMIKKYSTEVKGYLKYRPDGLFAIIFDKNQSRKLGEIFLTNDFNKMMNFIGLNPEEKYKGFNTLKEIYDWIISCKYFKKDIFFFENLNQSDRKRNKKRPTFTEFLNYIKDIRNENDKDDFVNNVSPNLIDSSFPEVHFLEQIEILKKKDEEKQIIRNKFNGELVMEWTNLKGKELGDVITKFKSQYANEIKECSSEEIKNIFLKWFNEKN